MHFRSRVMDWQVVSWPMQSADRAGLPEMPWVQRIQRPRSPQMRPVGPFLAHSCHAYHQFAPHHPQISQSKLRLDLGRVLLQSAISNLGVAKLALDHPDRTLRRRPNSGVDLLRLVNQRHQREAQVQYLAPAREHRNRPIHLRTGIWPFGHATVASIAKRFLLLPVKQSVGRYYVVDVGRCGVHQRHQARFGIHTSVGLHAEAPLVALLGLAHLAVAFRPLVPMSAV